MSDPREIELIRAVDSSIEKVRTKSLDISFNELFDMHLNKELVIDPDYQRLFRWSEEKQSQFVESLVLEMPTPPIFVIEKEEGVYELIDGLQRISSYLHFRGTLQVQEGEDQYLGLTGCDIVKELNGFTFESLPTTLKIRLKRSFIRMEVIKNQSDDRLKYYMFKRLNTGGEILSDQEIRNCTIRIFDDKFNDFIIEMSKDQQYINSTSLVDEDLISKKYDQELVLRFLALKNYRDQFRNNLSDFLTNYMEKVTTGEIEFDYNLEKLNFEKTFAVVSKSLDKFAFSRINQNDTTIATFLPYYYEAISLGLASFIERIDLENEPLIEAIRTKIVEVKKNDEFKRITSGGGKTKKPALIRRVDFVTEAIGEIFK